MTHRRATVHRATGETDVRVTLDLDGGGSATVATGLPFYDHMWTALAKHGRLDLTLHCEGDLEVDDHHTVEDCALAVGAALREAVGDRRGLRRFGHAYAPLDEALVRAVVDLSGRPWPEIHLDFRRGQVGAVSTEMLVHALQSLSMEGRFNLHVDGIRARNDHHLAEAAFKAVGLALRHALDRVGDGVPSTKGTLA